MKSPFTGTEAEITREWVSMTFRKESFRVLFHAYRCPDTGNSFEDEAFTQLNYNQLVNQYRAKYALPFPNEIVKIRIQYGLSAARLSEILGFGTNVWRLYENGEVPNLSNGKLIQLAADPGEFKKLVARCGTIDEKHRSKIYDRIEILFDEKRQERANRDVENYLLGSEWPNEQTGYTRPDLSKLTEMVVFFAEKMQPWKTKLNKLLFYSDFAMFKQSGFSISGTSYRAIPMGPVPEKYHSLFEYICAKEQITVQSTAFPDGGIGEQFLSYPNRTFNSSIFTAAELDVLHLIADRFEKTTTQEIIDLSHRETAWTANEKDHKLIDYKYAFELNGV
ncbi:MAG: type II toxin-antitoxin system antitoxin SocA domain-containing protein [Bacteroidales bacterium]|nr:DUF4065 domain-containing protein [Bacteroidales bacterium]